MNALPTLLLAAATAAPPAVDLWGSLEPGPHAVGFRLEKARAAELLPSIPTRDIELAVWYPATPGAAPAMTFEDYFRAAPDLRRRAAGQGVSADDLPRVLSATLSGDASALDPSVLARALAAPLRAVREAAPVAGPFPVVLWSSRYGTTAAQCVLSEYLASHGFLVAFARPREAVERLPFEATTAEQRADELEEQVRDLRGALHALHARPEAGPAAAVLAWSYAGESAVRLARTDASVIAVVGLSTNTAAQWVYAPEALAALPAGPLDIPFTLMAEESSPPGSTPQPGVWEALPPGSARAVFPQLRHGSFNVVEGLLPAVLGIDKVQRWSRSGPEGRAGYETICRLVLSALRAAIARDPAPLAQARAGLDPAVARLEWKDGPWPVRAAPQAVSYASAGGLVIRADLYAAARPSGLCLALFHQSGSSRGEYLGIAPQLATLGYTSLAVDLRWGRRDRFNGVLNESARAAGTAEILASGDPVRREALSAATTEDMSAALAWLAARPDCARGVVPWGSSFSANRVLELAVDPATRVRAVVSFSPGEYDPKRPEATRTIARRLAVPTFIVWGRGEAELGAPVNDAVPQPHRRSYASPLGFHGSSILYDDPAAWPPLLAFLATLSR